MNPKRPFNGTIIRIPLQKDRSASRISQHTLSVEEAAASVQSWAQKAGKSLLFLRHTMRLGLSIWRPNAITLTNLLEVLCPSISRLGLLQVITSWSPADVVIVGGIDGWSMSRCLQDLTLYNCVASS